MKIVPAAEGLDAALAALRGGGIVIHATETCYGIACDLTNPAAVRKLFDFKRRPYTQPVSALFSSVDAAASFVTFSPRARALAAEHLPGPLTLVLPKLGSTPLWITTEGDGNDPMIGVRVSSHPLATHIAAQFGRPIATTSANVHGAPNPYSIVALREQFGASADVLVIDNGILSDAPPSTVLEVKNDAVRVIRQGDIRISEM